MEVTPPWGFFFFALFLSPQESALLREKKDENNCTFSQLFPQIPD